ncbi:MAG: hypothetical protein AAF443_08925 [Chlamydiota bacterium]
MAIFNALGSIPSQISDNFSQISRSKRAEAKTFKVVILASKTLGFFCVYKGASSLFSAKSTASKTMHAALLLFGHDLVVHMENRYDMFISALYSPSKDVIVENLAKKIFSAGYQSIGISTVFSALTKPLHETKKELRNKVCINLDKEFCDIPENQKKFMSIFQNALKDAINYIDISDKNLNEGKKFEESFSKAISKREIEAYIENTLILSPLVKAINPLWK